MPLLFLDQAARDAIERLVKEEHRLHQQRKLADADHRRLREIHAELDGYLAALREQRSHREARENTGPDRARPRLKVPVRNA